MRKITIYTIDTCPFCTRAKRLLDEHQLPFEEHDVTNNPEQRAWLRQATGRKTVPQLFIDQSSIGGCDDLEALLARGAHEQWR